MLHHYRLCKITSGERVLSFQSEAKGSGFPPRDADAYASRT